MNRLESDSAVVDDRKVDHNQVMAAALPHGRVCHNSSSHCLVVAAMQEIFVFTSS